MKVYIIEHGSCCQHGNIFKAYQTIQAAIQDLQFLADNRRKPGYVVTPGLGDDNNSGLAICGFWAGPEKGNQTAEGWRVVELTML